MLAGILFSQKCNMFELAEGDFLLDMKWKMIATAQKIVTKVNEVESRRMFLSQVKMKSTKSIKSAKPKHTSKASPEARILKKGKPKPKATRSTDLILSPTPIRVNTPAQYRRKTERSGENIVLEEITHVPTSTKGELDEDYIDEFDEADKADCIAREREIGGKAYQQERERQKIDQLSVTESYKRQIRGCGARSKFNTYFVFLIIFCLLVLK